MSVPDNVTISLNLNNAPMLRFDQPSMKRVFYNLILNAFQAMPDGGTLTITANATDEEVRITVADTGKGIPKRVCQEFLSPSSQPKHRDKDWGYQYVKSFLKLTAAASK